MSNVNDLWYTPDYVLRVVDRFFGAGAWDDPCPANPINNGLDRAWGESCFINPPYSRELKRAFIVKGLHEYYKIGDREYIWLVNYACSSDVKILKTEADAVCLPDKRISFIPGHPGLKAGSPRYDNIFLYWGQAPGLFRDVFRELGATYSA